MAMTTAAFASPAGAAALRTAFARDGAAVVRGAFSAAWMDLIATSVEANLRSPGPFASENVQNARDKGRGDGQGCFWDDYVNWRRIPELEAVIRGSPARHIAAVAMGSTTSQFFHDHVLVKEPGTTMATPWHQDAPYYFVDGEQTVSMWIPLEPVEEGKSTLRFLAGSHLWGGLVKPVSWADDSDFHPSDPASGHEPYLPIPDPDAGKHVAPPNGRGGEGDRELGAKVLEWSLEPGDAVLFHFRTVHGARGNDSATKRRRALSLRWVGDDASFVERQGGRTSPPLTAPFGGAEAGAQGADAHGMKEGQRLRDDWFPVLWP